MELLSERQVDLIHDYLVGAGLSYKPLETDLVDHFCCMVESKMEDGVDFDMAFSETAVNFGSNHLSDIQEFTIHLVNQKITIMKKLVGVLGLVSAISVILGVVFKINHFKGAGVLLVVGISLAGVLVLPLMGYIDMANKKEGMAKVSSLTAYIAGGIFALSALFKIMHWPGFGILYWSSIAIFTLVYLPMMTIKNYRLAENKLLAVSKSLILLAGLSIVWGFGPIQRTVEQNRANQHQVEPLPND